MAGEVDLDGATMNSPSKESSEVVDAIVKVAQVFDTRVATTEEDEVEEQGR